MRKVNLAQKFAAIQELWSPKIVGQLNGQLVKLVKFKGEFVWHHHENEDEMFLVTRGRFIMQLRDGDIDMNAGEFIIIPRGVEHRPVADQECEVLLFEPDSTVNTGSAGGPRTILEPEQL